jgi:hypothetical protein
MKGRCRRRVRPRGGRAHALVSASRRARSGCGAERKAGKLLGKMGETGERKTREANLKKGTEPRLRRAGDNRLGRPRGRPTLVLAGLAITTARCYGRPLHQGQGGPDRLGLG